MLATLLSALILTVWHVLTPGTDGRVERVVPNDNRQAAGRLRGSVLVVNIEARRAMWYPNGDSEPGVSMPAFAEVGRPATIPGPLLRVRAGAEVEIDLRNALATDTLVVHGLQDRTGVRIAASALEGVRLAPGEHRVVRFRLTTPGTYYYWGSTTKRDVTWRTGQDSQLTGAIVVDSLVHRREDDRVLVIGLWTDTVARAYYPRRRILAVVNGRSWPYTERLRYNVGDTVRWHVINASGDNHPMHLHGFTFRVDSRGDDMLDASFPDSSADRVVTESMSPGTTMHITWVAARRGNWLFHCHLPEHIGRRGPLGMEPTSRTVPAKSMAGGMNGTNDTMGGLVLGIEVRGRDRPIQAGDVAPAPPPRMMHLLIRTNTGSTDSLPYFGFALQEKGTPVPVLDPGLKVGPPLVLTRGEPVGITVVNLLNEPTTVHWHGIELESFYDGVAGFSGMGQRIAPAIAAHDSFEVQFTPPQVGTFIYHTHVDEERQEPAGLAGPIIVLERGERWNPSADHAVLITSPWSWEEGRNAVLLNGSPAPAALTIRAGERQRFRIINMTTRRPALRVELRRDTTLLTWRELAKDAVAFPERRRLPRQAVHQISVGETFDFDMIAEAEGDMRLDVLLGGKVTEHPLFATLPIHVRTAEAKQH